MYKMFENVIFWIWVKVVIWLFWLKPVESEKPNLPSEKVSAPIAPDTNNNSAGSAASLNRLQSLIARFSQPVATSTGRLL